MSTPNTHAPGSPEWLRKRADDEQSADAKVAAILGGPAFDCGLELVAGLRAAAERIALVEGDLCATLEVNSRLRAENEQLRKDYTTALGLAADTMEDNRERVKAWDAKWAELERENEALAKALTTAEVALRHGLMMEPCDPFRRGKIISEGLDAVRAAIKQARKEGA